MKKLKEKYDTYDDHQLVESLLNSEEDAVSYFFYHKCSKLLDYVIFTVFDNYADKRELVRFDEIEDMKGNT